MIVFKRFPLRNAEPDTAGTGLNLEPETDGDPTLNASGDGEGASPSTPEDRGDVVTDPAPSEQALRAVAGDVEDPRGNTRPVANEEGDADAGARRSPHVPISRFNEVNEAKKTAEAEAERLRQELEQLRASKAPAATPASAPAAAPAQPVVNDAPAFDFDGAETQYAELLADGEFDKAKTLRAEIRNAERAEAVRAALEAQQQAKQEADLKAQVEAAKSIADQAVIDYPYLDTPEGAPAMAAIVAERDRLMRAGQPMAEALQAAVNKFGPIFAGSSQHAPSSVLPTGSKPADTRPAAAAERGAKASTQQPAPLTGGMGNAAQATRLDPMNMTDEQFEALSPAEKARLRGD